MANFIGSGSDDSFTGTGGADTIASGGGKDTLNGAGGNDAIALNAPLTAGSTIDGGSGTDTLVLTALPNPTMLASYLFPQGITSSNHVLSSSTFLSLERIEFESTAGTQVGALFGFGDMLPFSSQFGAGGIAADAELTGGSGRDAIVLIGQFQGSNITVDAPVFGYTDWQTPDRAYRGGDLVSLSVFASGGATINGAPHQGVLFLNGGAGNDTINGSADMDLLTGNGGVNILNGNGGDDTLAFINTITITVGAGGEIVGQSSSGNVAQGFFGGGEGVDFLALGGPVNFAATIESIEGIYLSPGFTNPLVAGQNSTRQDPTAVLMSSTVFDEFPSDLVLDGVGSIRVDLVAGAGFDGSNFVFEAGSDVSFIVIGTGLGETIVATAGDDIVETMQGDDTITGGDGDDFVNGGSGKDVAIFSGNRAAYTVAEGEDHTLLFAGPGGEDTLLRVETFRFADGDYVWRDGALTPASDAATGSFRLFAADGFAGEVGGTGQVFGTEGFQYISLIGVSTVTFDPSFNRGGDVIRLPDQGFNHSVRSSGSTAILTNDISTASIPVGLNDTEVQFENGVQLLRIEGGVIKLGPVTLTAVPEDFLFASQEEPTLDDVDPAAIARVFLGEGTPIELGGNYNVFGTDGEEQVTWRSGNLLLDPSFNRGGDTLIVDALAADLRVYRSGSSVVLLRDQASATIPVGRDGMMLEFAAGDETDARELFIDQASGTIRIGDQVISATSAASAVDLDASSFASFG